MRVSINGHKFIASISTEDLSELLIQKYADIYEEITTRQAQVLEDISKEIQNNPDKDKVSEIPQDPSAVLSAIQKVNKEREQLSKPFSVLSELSRKILRYNAIHVTGRVIRGEATCRDYFGKRRRWNYSWERQKMPFPLTNSLLVKSRCLVFCAIMLLTREWQFLLMNRS